MAHIFISYRSTDRDFVLRLASDLRNVGFDIWLDQWKITGRKPYWNEIQEGVEGCSHFVFVISPESIAEDSGAMTELYHVEKLSPRRVIVPVVARDTSFDALPMLITPGKYQIHDFTKLPYRDALDRVIRALQSPISTPPTGTQKQRVAASAEQSHNRKLGDIPGGWATMLAAIIGGLFLIGLVLIPIWNSNQQAAQTQTVAAITLTQNVPTSAVITATSGATVPLSATFTLTIASTATDTITPTSTDTPHPTVTSTSTITPSETSDIVRIAAQTSEAEETSLAATIAINQTINAINTANAATRTTIAIASFTQTPTPTVSSTPRPAEPIQPTNAPVVRSYPCPATVSTAYGSVLQYFASAAGGSSSGSVRAGDAIQILDKSKNLNAPKYLIANAAGRQLGYIHYEYVILSTSCP